MSPEPPGSRPPNDRLAEHVHVLTDPMVEDGRTLGDVVDEFGDATVVGVGEPAHGIRDCHRLQRRVIRHLVEAHGLRAVALETHYSAALAVDEYVAHGTGDAVEALDSLEMWVWRTEGVLELVEWLRDFNRDRLVDDRVRFYGVDVQGTTAAAERVGAYLERVDPSFRSAHADGLAILQAGVRTRDVDSDADAVLERADRAQATVDALAARFDREREADVDATTSREYALARRHVDVLDAAIDLTRITIERGVSWTYGARRDRAMARNVRWLHDDVGHDQLALVAANGHLRRGHDQHDDSDPGDGPLGYHLDRAYGDDYRALGTEFGVGSVRTKRSGKDAASFPAQDLDVPPGDSLVGALREVADATAFLDLDAAGSDDALADWLEAAAGHVFGPVYDPDRGAGLSDSIDYAWELDGILFVPEAAATALLDAGTERAGDSS
jgi:erythromycin esterase